jgi:lysophospholipase L1-like esterase
MRPGTLEVSIKQRVGHGVAAALAVAVGGSLVAIGAAARRVARRGHALVRESRRFVRRPPSPTARLLVVGDSAGVGVGASDPSRSIAGRLGLAHPTWSIGNLSRSGSRTEDVAALLRRLDRRLGRRTGLMAERPYRAVIIHTGGNDALHLTSRRRLAAALKDAIGAAQRIAEQPVVVTGGNLALAPAFPPPLAWVLGLRSRTVREVFCAVTTQRSVTFVDLYRRPGADPTASNPPRFFAADGLHPSDANYAIWFEEIELALRKVPRTVRRESAEPGEAWQRGVPHQ